MKGAVVYLMSEKVRVSSPLCLIWLQKISAPKSVDLNFYTFIYLTYIIQNKDFLHHCNKGANWCYYIIILWTKV